MNRLVLYIIVLLIPNLIFGQFNFNPRDWEYETESWYIDPYPYHGFGAYPDSGIVAYTEMLTNEPMFCYPMHSGNVRGVSDTVMVYVHIKNLDTTDFNISSFQPETWFMPVVYDVSTDPNRFAPMADTSNLSYAFVSWFDGLGNPVFQPMYITKKRGSPRYYLVYYVWNLPVGRSRLLMIGTSSLPSCVQVMTNYIRPVWVVKPNSSADTLNALGACLQRARQLKNFTAAVSWSDSMLSINPSSVPGYILRAKGYDALGDSLNEGTALDSAIAILERYGDDVLGDTTYWNAYEKRWHYANYNLMLFFRWQLVSGKKHLRLF